MTTACSHSSILPTLLIRQGRPAFGWREGERGVEKRRFVGRERSEDFPSLSENWASWRQNFWFAFIYRKETLPPLSLRESLRYGLWLIRFRLPIRA